MNFFFAHPWGLLALAGIPTVVAIHFLRRKSRQVPASTVFLIKDVLKSREGGRRLRIPRASLPLWIQILAVILLAFLLAGPRWVDPSSSVRAVVVMDRSASMGAYREAVESSLGRLGNRISGIAGTVEWTVIGSDSTPIAKGSDWERLDIADKWQPTLGAHDISDSLRLARSLAGESGLVTFLSDHPPPGDIEGIEWIACGQPLDNAAILSASALDEQWSALVTNFSRSRGVVPWRVDGGEWNSLALEPGETAEIFGDWGEGRMLLELADDALSIDNTAPLLVPQKKTLGVARDPAGGPVFERLLRLAEPSLESTDGADVYLTLYDPLSPGLPGGPALVFVKDPSNRTRPLTGEPMAENHPLMADLNWRGLLVADSLGVPSKEGDIPLLWIGERRVVFLRQTGAGPQLIFNFDVESSNVLRLPAFALLVHRFLQNIREQKIEFSSDNLRTGEKFFLAGKGIVSAPATPGFFSFSNHELLFEGAALFSDPRESDLRQASSGEFLSGDVSVVQTTNSRGKAWEPLLALLLGALFVWNWWLTGDRTNRSGLLIQS